MGGLLSALAALAAVGIAGWFFTHKLLPWTVAFLLGLLGIRPRLTPMMQKRIRRFVSIKRGYYAFVFITTLFVISLFLELLVNDKALLIVYEDRWAMPAVAEWIDEMPILGATYYHPASEFGLTGEQPINCRQFVRYTKDPGLLDKEIASQEVALEERRQRFAKKRPPKKPKEVKAPGEEPKKPAHPGENATQDQLDEYEEAVEDWEDEHADWEDATADYDAYINEDLKYYAEDLKDYEEERNDIGLIATEIEEQRKTALAFREGRAWAIMPLYPFHPKETLLEELEGRPPHWPTVNVKRPGATDEDDTFFSLRHQPLGTTDNGIDILCQLLYGFRISALFALIVATVGYTIGIIVGGIMGYYGGWIDILVQRFIEIWGSIPFLFTMMIIASIIQPSLLVMALMLIVLRSWMGITWTIRGEFYREKARDYVQAAIAMGVSDWKIMTRHILPNSLVPVVTFAPFGIVAYITTLVSLDYLGYGLKAGTPSWGYLLQQGQTHLSTYYFLIIVPVLAFAGTLFCVVTIGEAVREGFDPKVFSRLR